MNKYKNMFLGIVIGIAVLLAGCSNKEIKLEEPHISGYEAVTLSLDGLMKKESIGNIYNCNDRLYFFTYITGKNLEEGISRFHFYKYDIQKQKVDSIPIVLGEDDIIIKILGNHSDELVMLKSKEDRCYIAKYDEAGVCTQEKDITEFKTGLEYISDVRLDKEDNLYCFGMNQIIVFDTMGENVNNFVTEGLFSDSYINKDGKICVCNLENESENIVELNLNSKKMDFYAKPIKEEWNTNLIGNVVESDYWDYIQNTGEALIGINVKEKKAQCLLYWNAIGLNPEMQQVVCQVSENTFVAINYDGMDGRANELILLQPLLEENVQMEEKDVITMAGLKINSFLKEAVYHFNKENKEYKLEIKDYQGDLSKLSTDLMTEGTIDLLCLDGLPKDRYVKKGLLCDLNPFLEQDEEIKKEDLLEPVYDLLSNKKGMYSWTPGFLVETVIGKASLLGGEYSCTPEKAASLQQELAEGKKLYYAMSRGEMMKKLIEANLNCFVNLDDGSCSFQNEKFMNLLRFAESFPKEEEDDMTMPQKVQADQIVFVREAITDFTSFMFYEKMFGEKISFTGYPAYDNPGNLFSAGGMETAILEQSQHKEGAWEYLKYITSESYLKQYCDMQFFPIRKDCIENYIQIMSATEAYVDEQGQEQEAYHCTVGYDDYIVELGALNEEQILDFWTLLEHMYLPVQLENGIWEIITEETERYFNGEIRKEECAGNLEKRIALYLEE